MPQMRIKASMTGWSNCNEDEQRQQSFAKFFFNNTPMYLLGVFDENDEYSHLSGNWQSDKVVCISLGEDDSISEKLVYAVDVPYEALEDNKFDEAGRSIVGNDKVGTFANLNTVLTEKVCGMQLVKYNDDSTVTTSGHDLIGSSVTLSTYKGTSLNNDEHIKPSDIEYNKEHPEFILKKVNVISSNNNMSDITYDLKTDDFWLYLKQGTTELSPVKCFYKIGVMPFVIDAYGNIEHKSIRDVTSDSDTTEGAITRLCNHHTLHIGNDSIALDGKNTFMFYFNHFNPTGQTLSPHYKITRLSYKTMLYGAIPMDVIFPLYYNNTADETSTINGLVYMKLYYYDNSTPKPYDYGDEGTHSFSKLSTVSDQSNKCDYLDLALHEVE